MSPWIALTFSVWLAAAGFDRGARRYSGYGLLTQKEIRLNIAACCWVVGRTCATGAWIRDLEAFALPSLQHCFFSLFVDSHHLTSRSVSFAKWAKYMCGRTNDNVLHVVVKIICQCFVSRTSFRFVFLWHPFPPYKCYEGLLLWFT